MSKKVLIIGASENPERYSYIAAKMLTEYGHEITLLGLRKGKIDDHVIFSSTDEISGTFDVVTLYINKEIQKKYYNFILALHPKRVIFNPGTENPELENLLAQNNTEPLEACTLVMLRSNLFDF